MNIRSKILSNVPREAMRRLRSFAQDDGTVTVEFMLWMPLIFTIILFTVDVALIYLKQADMWNVARDISRRMSVDSSVTNASAQTQAQNQLFTSLSSATITATGGTVAGQDKVVTIQIGLCNASLFGVVGCYDNTLQLTARVTMASEY
ncbi:MAG TPA: TadE family protein [Rhizomicrobium sp.]|nr:TadE family protein [Rhizomicrobium sp.]